MDSVNYSNTFIDGYNRLAPVVATFGTNGVPLDNRVAAGAVHEVGYSQAVVSSPGPLAGLGSAPLGYGHDSKSSSFFTLLLTLLPGDDNCKKSTFRRSRLSQGSQKLHTCDERVARPRKGGQAPVSIHLRDQTRLRATAGKRAIL